MFPLSTQPAVDDAANRTSLGLGAEKNSRPERRRSSFAVTESNSSAVVIAHGTCVPRRQRVCAPSKQAAHRRQRHQINRSRASSSRRLCVGAVSKRASPFTRLFLSARSSCTRSQSGACLRSVARRPLSRSRRSGNRTQDARQAEKPPDISNNRSDFVVGGWKTSGRQRRTARPISACGAWFSNLRLSDESESCIELDQPACLGMFCPRKRIGRHARSEPNA